MSESYRTCTYCFKPILPGELYYTGDVPGVDMDLYAHKACRDTSGEIRAAAEEISRCIAQIPLLYRLTGDGLRKPVPNHPLNRIHDQPRHYPRRARGRRPAGRAAV